MEFDELNDDQQALLSHFQVIYFLRIVRKFVFDFAVSFSPQEITNLDSIEVSVQYLVANDWDVQRAINTYLSSQSDSDQTPVSTPEPVTTTTNNQILPRPPSFVTRYIPHHLL